MARQAAAVYVATDAAQKRLVIVVAVVVDGAVDYFHRGAHGLVFGLGGRGVHRRDYLHDSARVQTTRLGHEVPQAKGQIEEERHERQYEGHPLVVVDLAVTCYAGRGQEVVGGHVVRVGYPAHVVRVLYHAAREVSGRPAGDRRAHELRRAHEYAE